MLAEWHLHEAEWEEYRQAIAALNDVLNCCTDVLIVGGGNGADGASDADGANNVRGAKAGALHGVPFAIKDNIALRGRALTCASAMLKDFVSPYTATVVQRLLDAGAVPAAKTNLDEFGMGSSTEHSCFGATKNPWDTEYVAGGSSGGSAAAVASGMVPFALGSDTGGSVRQPASFCGVYGLKPTYGALSRFGLVAYASSLETIGIFATSPEVVRTVFEATRGADVHDQTSVAASTPDHMQNDSARQSADDISDRSTSYTSGHVPRPTIGYITELGAVDKVICTHYTQMVQTLTKMGYRCQEVRIPYQSLIAPAYYTIASAEAGANLARYDGVKYGMRHVGHQNPAAMTHATRSAGFGAEVKLRILLGAYVLRSGFQKQYYLKAQQIRRYLKAQMGVLFNTIDMLLLPTFPSLPFRIARNEFNAFQQKQADVFTCLANLTEQPALSMPIAVHHGLPVGMQCIGRPHQEQLLFDMANQYRVHFQIGVPPHYMHPPQHTAPPDGHSTTTGSTAAH